ncbi:hypothetical protein [Xenococcus sp. PCC 7305]|uniref:hypothetical protein n=1 Tax=Xenococcus sp. PCC 7305 TaxID=102125 RepID=UPI000318E4A1|nr:hypothetical protein [Xenococcus sp. PCC 7305]
MKILRYSSSWFFCFTLLFLLALDFWAWQRDIVIGLGYLPDWIFYFVGLQLALALALFVFTKQFWARN